jgi:hypothetical protein
MSLKELLILSHRCLNPLLQGSGLPPPFRWTPNPKRLSRPLLLPLPRVKVPPNPFGAQLLALVSSRPSPRPPSSPTPSLCRRSICPTPERMANPQHSVKSSSRLLQSTRSKSKLAPTKRLTKLPFTSRQNPRRNSTRQSAVFLLF